LHDSQGNHDGCLESTANRQNLALSAYGVTESSVSRRLANADRITLGQLDAMCAEMEIDCEPFRHGT